MQKRHVYLTIIILLISSLGGIAQEQEKVPLSEILSDIERTYSCTFSYNNEALENQYARFKNTKSLNAALAYLQQETVFTFTFVSVSSIAVSLQDDVQQYCLEIRANETGKPLKDVPISTSFQQKKTDANGLLTLLLPPRITTVRIGGDRLATTEVLSTDFTTSKCNTIILRDDVEQLTPIFLTQYITQGIEKETNGTIAINTEDFLVLPGLIENDVLFTLQALPGIQSVNENVSYLNIRGGTNDQNLMRWDGIKMYQNGHFFGLISAFNPSLTHRVNLIRNGTRASLGDGVSGTVELFTDNTVTKTFSSEIGLNMISTDAFTDIPITKNASVQIAGRKSLNNFWSSPTYTAYFEKAFQNTEVSRNFSSRKTKAPDFSFYDIGTRFLWNPSEKDRIRINLLSYQNELTFSEEENNNTPQNNRTLNSGLTQKSLAGGFSHQRQWNDGLETQFQAYITNYALRARNADLANDQSLLQKNAIEESALYIQGKKRLFANASAILGYEFVETGITNLQEIDNPLFFREEKNVIRRHSAFASLLYVSENKKTNIDVGIRTNHYSKFNTTLIEPRLSLSHRFLSYFAVEVLGELKSQHTSQAIDLQKDFLGVENRRWLLSNPENVPLLQSQQTSVALSYSRRGLLLNVEPYLKKVTGITTRSQGFQNQFENVRDTGSYTVKGVDVLLNKAFDNATVWLSYSYADNKYTFDTLEPSVFHNNLDITHTLTLGGNYSWKQFNFSTGLNWHTGKPFTRPNATNPVVDGTINYAFPNKARIRDYVRVDSSILYNFKISENIKAMAGVSFWNLLNRENHVRSFFSLDEQEQVQQINDRALPFTPNAAFRVFF